MADADDIKRYIQALRQRAVDAAGGEKAFARQQLQRRREAEQDARDREQRHREHLQRMREGARAAKEERIRKQWYAMAAQGQVFVVRAAGEPATQEWVDQFCEWVADHEYEQLLKRYYADKENLKRRAMQAREAETPAEVVEKLFDESRHDPDKPQYPRYVLRRPVGVLALSYGLDLLKDMLRGGRIVTDPFQFVLAIAKKVMAGMVPVPMPRHEAEANGCQIIGTVEEMLEMEILDEPDA